MTETTGAGEPPGDRLAAGGACAGGGSRSALQALLSGRCPRCREGRIFARRLAMNPRCPVCGLPFEREPGYFTGAMYISYALAVPIVGGFTAVLSLVLPPGWPLHWTVLLAGALFLPAVPLVFRASRVAWIHLDHRLDPSP